MKIYLIFYKKIIENFVVLHIGEKYYKINNMVMIFKKY